MLYRVSFTVSQETESIEAAQSYYDTMKKFAEGFTNEELSEFVAFGDKRASVRDEEGGLVEVVLERIV